jgi:hypothetical protein
MADLDKINRKLDELLSIALGNQAVLSVLADREAIRDAWERGTEVTDAQGKLMREVMEAREILDGTEQASDE